MYICTYIQREREREREREEQRSSKPHPNRSASRRRTPQRGTKPSFPIALICATRRRIQARGSTNQGLEKGDLILLLGPQCSADADPEACALRAILTETRCS